MTELENEKIKLEKNMEMEREMVNIRDLLKKEVDLLEKAQSISELEKCSLAAKLEKSQKRCEELVLRLKKMESDKAAQLYKSRLHVSPEVCVIYDDSGESGANCFMSKKGGKDMAYSDTEDDADFTYPGSNPANISAVAESKGSGLDNEGRTPDIKGASCPASPRCHCNLKVIKIIQNNLHKENLETFEQMCFGNLLKMNEFKFQGQLIKQLLLQMDMKACNERRLVFRINNSNMEFRPLEFFHITGLRFGKLDAFPANSSLYKDVFQCRPNISLTDIEEAFINISRRDNGKGDLTLKLSLLYFLYGTLLVRRCYQKVDLQYLHCVEDLEKFNAFPWGRVAYELLVSSIRLVRSNMDSSKSGFSIYGFCYALQAWVYEMMPSLATYCAYRASNFENITPWILRWSAIKLIKSDDLKIFFPLGDNAHLKTTTVEWEELSSEVATPLSKAQENKRKFLCDDDQMLNSQPSSAATPTTPPPTSTYPFHHLARRLSRAEGAVESLLRKFDQPMDDLPRKEFPWVDDEEDSVPAATLARHNVCGSVAISMDKATDNLGPLATSLLKTERATALSDTPQLLWMKCCHFQISESEYERSKALYEMLLDRTKHLKLWNSYAKFEAFAMIEGLQNRDKKKGLRRARGVFERGLSYLRSCDPELKEERAMLLEEWFDMEYRLGEVGGDVDLVRAKLPQKLKRRRRLEGTAGYEEYVDYLFPEEKRGSDVKILEAAYKWKKKQKSLIRCLILSILAVEC